MFSFKKFRTPESIHTPGYFWLLNGKLTESELRAQIRDMAEHGARTICPHPLPKEFRASLMSEMSPCYLSEEYLKLFEVIADECKKLHLTCYLYDEGGWPSGGACGRVYASDPEHFARCFVSFDAQGNPKFEKETPGLSWSAAQPDLLHPGVTEKFLELTHEQYAKHIGKHFGKTYRFVFTDEPAMLCPGNGRLSWTEDFAEVFKFKKGYDITPYLCSIIQWDNSAEAVQHRIDYYDVLAWLFVERYTLPIRDWCRKHHLLSGGHMAGEDYLVSASTPFGKLLRTLRTLDFPGVDVIWRQIWMDKRLHSFPKFASSVANQNGSRYVSAEMFCIYGQGLTFEQMRFVLDYFVVCGINCFVSCGRPYSTKDGSMIGERPHSGPVNPQWEHFREYHDYTARISMLGSLGCPVVDTALLLDDISCAISPENGRSAEALREQIAFQLAGQQCDFDYIDNDVLATAKIRNGKARIGKAEYAAIVIPAGAPLTGESQKNVEKLRARGVKIISQDEICEIAPTLALKYPDWRLRVRKRILSGGDVLYFVFNSSHCRIDAEFQAVEKSDVARCDCETGEIHTAGTKGKWRYSFAPYRAEIFLIGPSAAKAGRAPAEPGRVIADLSGKKWTLRPEKQHSVGEHDYVIAYPKRKAVPVKLGDWSCVLGRGFSGEAVYSAEFDYTPGMRFLDLGKVCYSAEVKVNGNSAGIRLYPPYVFDLKKYLQPGKNRIEVHVVNTLANAILEDGVLEGWKKLPFEGCYDKIQRRFEQESLSSGLFGPVTLKA